MGIFNFGRKKKNEGLSILASESDLKPVNKTPTQQPVSSQPVDELPKYVKGDIINAGTAGNFRVYDVKAGGMGFVYLVLDESAMLPKALKTFQEWCLNSPNSVERFTREAQTWIKLGNHPHIVKADLIHLIDRRPFIFLEFIAGTDLANKIRSQKLSIQDVLKFSIHFCRGMAYAETKIPGFIHRDIKPANCLITSDNILKVTDFGLVKSIDKSDFDASLKPQVSKSETQIFKTQAGQLGVGTIPYMSPEQFADFKNSTTQSDIYSFGIMLFEMLTGNLPFTGTTAEEFIFHHFRTIPVDPRRLNTIIPKELAEITLECLQKHSLERPKNFRDLEIKFSEILSKNYNESVEVITEEENSWSDSVNQATSLQVLGKYQEAIEVFDSVINKTNDLSPDLAIVWANKANALFSLGKADEALECINQALSLDKHLGTAWNNKGEILSRLGKNEEALATYNQALVINPDDWEVLSNLGVLLGKMGKDTEAVQSLENALKIHPKSPVTLLNLASILPKIGEIERAVKLLKKAVEIDSSYASAYFNLGLLYYDLENFVEAVKYFQLAVKLNPKNYEFLIWLGNAVSKIGSSKQAINYFKQAIEIAPRQSKAHTCLGFEYMKLRKTQEAFESLNWATHLNPHDTEAHLHLGVLYFDMGNQQGFQMELMYLSAFAPSKADYLRSFTEKK